MTKRGRENTLLFEEASLLKKEQMTSSFFWCNFTSDL